MNEPVEPYPTIFEEHPRPWRVDSPVSHDNGMIFDSNGDIVILAGGFREDLATLIVAAVNEYQGRVE